MAEVTGGELVARVLREAGVAQLGQLVARAERPLMIAGGGVYRDAAAEALGAFAAAAGIPV
jgi:thiamine pyrophosphate-dependent acetolactate synthase large subunit-like protein